MTEFTFETDAAHAPYNLAHLVDDRSYLSHRFDVEPAYDDGVADPGTGRRDAPPDFGARRRAVVEFYGDRCGRCATRIDTGSADDGEVAYLFSVADDTEDSWALRHLVAVCEPCYDLLSTDCTDRIGGFGDAYRRAPQFPAWIGDPRVAVERLPLSGREVWFRDRLSERVDVEAPTGESVNGDAAREACLARSTPAAVAVALNEALVADERGPLSTANRRLCDRWDTLSERERTEYERRAVDAETVVGGGFEPCVDLQRA
ncbi:hypothetical protein [Haloarchaeobius litoreus]|uniref:HNH endonuclease n=1 Tax=Haloarchaeobius litoreus TaxID=755306 RepID=A0ABD6DKW3_9EURY|nr:hypothetical protein [Haloarchaeobius litoreus]